MDEHGTPLETTIEGWNRFFALSLDILAIVDLDGFVKRVNPAVECTLGYAKAEVLGRRFIEFVHPDDRRASEAEFQKVAEGRPIVYFENRYRRKDGSYRWLAWTVAPDLQRSLAYAIGRDITAKKWGESERARLALEQAARAEAEVAERKLHAIVETMPIGVVVCNHRGEVTLTNEVARELLGVDVTGTLHEAMGRFGLYRPDGTPFPRIELPLPCAIERGEITMDIEVRVRREDGTERIILASGSPIIDKEGHVIAGVAVFQDITERKRSEERLRDSAERFRLIATHSPDIMFFQDRGLRYTWVANPAPPLTSELIEGKTDYDVFAVEEARRLTTVKIRVLETGVGERYEPRLTIGGVEHHLEAIYEPRRDKQGNIVGLFGYVRDITWRKKAEEALRESEERYRTLAETAQDHIYIVSRDLRVQYINSYGARHTGTSAEQAIGKPIEEVFPPDTSAGFKGGLLKVFETGKPTHTERRLLIRGREVWMSSGLVPLRNAAGEVTAVMGISRDITARKRAEQALRESEERYKNLVEMTTDIIYVSDAKGNKTFMNDAGYRILEARPDEVIGRPWLTWIHPEDRKRTAETYSRMIARGVDVFEFENRFVSKSGRAIDVIQNIRVMRDETGHVIGTQGIARDVTQRMRTEKLREEYLSLVSHDLRAPLTIVRGQAQVIERYADRPDLVRKGADSISTAAQRMTAMIQDLVDSVRLETGQLALEKKSVNINRFVTDLLERAGAMLDVGRIKPEIAADLPLVDADPNRLERILLNLISNALKYSSPGTDVLLRAQQTDGAVTVSVTDRGMGIPKEDVPRLFERFYRAKGTRKTEGLGLGLYITRMLVEAHGGRIWVESEPGIGSTFYFSLPASRIVNSA